MASMRMARSPTWLNLGEYMEPLLNAFEAEARLAQSVADGGDVGSAAGFKSYIDHGLTQADSVIGAVVDGLNNIGALDGEDLGEGEQGARAVLKIDADAQ